MYNHPFFRCIGFLILFLMCSCSSTSQKDQIEFLDNKADSLLLGTPDLVLPLDSRVESLGDRALLSVKERNGMFYLLDGQSKKLYSISSGGNTEYVIDRVGRGPGEYLNILDFDVSKDNSEIMKKIALELNRMINTSNFEKNKNEYGINLFANNAYTLNKMYNYISLKLLNIIYSVFYLGDNYYNAIFNKLKIGLLISELFVNQLETLSLFLNFDNIDISILNNYMAEVKIRLGFIESISSLPKNFDDIKMQFLQSDFINYIFKYMIDDMRYFRTNSKKLTLEFIQYKNSFPLRNEAMTFLDIIFKKYYDIKKRTETDCFIFDEIIRNVKVFHLVQNQLSIIKTKIKGNEVLSVLGFFNMVLKNNEREIIKIMNSENAKDYFIYALQKETHLKKMFPLIVEYISKLQAGIEK